jgi:hypothetical protein
MDPRVQFQWHLRRTAPENFADLRRIVPQLTSNQPITTQQSPNDLAGAADRAVALQGVDGILAARGVKAALTLEELAKGHAIKAHELNQQPRHLRSLNRHF